MGSKKHTSPGSARRNHKIRRTATEKAMILGRDKLSALSPDVLPILEKIDTGVLSLQEALTEIVFSCKAAGTLPGLQEYVQRYMQDGMVQGKADRRRLAVITERLQFDGDIPELRTGPLPDDSMPAVPVVTDSLHAAEVGLLLEQASRTVKDQVVKHYAALIAQSEETGEGALINLPYADPQVYRRGRPASALEVTTAPEKSLLSLTRAEQSGYIWKALTSSQGRRSLLRPITARLEQDLKDKGVVVSVIHADPGKGWHVVGYGKWELDIVGGQGSIQPSYPYVDAACRRLLREITADLDLHADTDKLLWVKTVDQIPDRRVGWEASVFQRAPNTHRVLPLRG